MIAVYERLSGLKTSAGLVLAFDLDDAFEDVEVRFSETARGKSETRSQVDDLHLFGVDSETVGGFGHVRNQRTFDEPATHLRENFQRRRRFQCDFGAAFEAQGRHTFDKGKRASSEG